MWRGLGAVATRAAKRKFIYILKIKHRLGLRHNCVGVEGPPRYARCWRCPEAFSGSTTLPSLSTMACMLPGHLSKSWMVRSGRIVCHTRSKHRVPSFRVAMENFNGSPRGTLNVAAWCTPRDQLKSEKIELSSTCEKCIPPSTSLWYRDPHTVVLRKGMSWG